MIGQCQLLVAPHVIADARSIAMASWTWTPLTTVFPTLPVVGIPQRVALVVGAQMRYDRDLRRHPCSHISSGARTDLFISPFKETGHVLPSRSAIANCGSRSYVPVDPLDLIRDISTS
nr:hypothetical protein CFP56_12148 [Quercus suber]